MPIYEYLCNDCDHKFETYLLLEDFDKLVFCPVCGWEAYKLVSIVSVFTRNGELKQIEQEAKRNGSVIVEPGMREEAKRNRGYMEEKRKSKIRKSIVSTMRDF